MIPGDRQHNKLEMDAEREAWIHGLSDGDRMSFYRNEGMSDAEIVAAECERYGIVVVGEPLGAWALLRHVYNNRDATFGMKDYTIRLLQEISDAAKPLVTNIAEDDDWEVVRSSDLDKLREAFWMKA